MAGSNYGFIKLSWFNIGLVLVMAGSNYNWFKLWLVQSMADSDYGWFKLRLVHIMAESTGNSLRDSMSVA